MPTRETALPDRTRPVPRPQTHHALNTPVLAPGPQEGLACVLVGMGCFWGAERAMWRLPGVRSTSVGYAGGFTAHATYEDVCTGRTGHTEVVCVHFDERELPLEALLAAVLEAHDPTQGDRQGNDVGTQYRSAIYLYDERHLQRVRAVLDAYEAALRSQGYPALTTELAMQRPYYFAEPEHQQYLQLRPWGYCGLKGTGVSCPL